MFDGKSASLEASLSMYFLRLKGSREGNGLGERLSRPIRRDEIEIKLPEVHHARDGYCRLFYQHSRCQVFAVEEHLPSRPSSEFPAKVDRDGETGKTPTLMS